MEVFEQFWDHLFIFATVKAGNFTFGIQLGHGNSLTKKQHSGPNWQGSGLREHPKKFGISVFVFAVIEDSNFKFGIQLGLGQ